MYVGDKIDSTYRNAYLSSAQSAAQSSGVPFNLFDAVVSQESNWNPWALGSKGEIGFSQLMPATSRNLGVNAWNPTENLQGGASLLGSLFKQFGNWRDALAAYNAGPTNLQAGYGYADKILAASGMTDPLGLGGTDNPMPGPGNASFDAATGNETWLGKFLAGFAGMGAFAVVALLLVALGLWVIINSARK